MKVTMKRFHVRVKQLKLVGLCREEKEKRVVAIEMKWKGPPKLGLRAFSFQGKSTASIDCTAQKALNGSQRIEWDEEFESVCDFSVSGPWKATFSVLCGDCLKPKAKPVVLGKVSMNLAELAAKMETEIENELPITLKNGGVASKATLLVTVNFAEVRGFQDSAVGTLQNSANSEKDGRILTRVMEFTSFRKRNKETNHQRDKLHLDESAVFELKCSAATESGSCTTSSETDPVRTSRRLLSWKKRRLNIQSSRKKVEPLNEKTGEAAEGLDVDQTTEGWESREIVSRDGQAKLKTNVFFASFDQRSEKAGGESACTALVAVITHWLHSNPQAMPTRSQFDSLIVEGSSEWQKLCADGAYISYFPDKHFDLEAVVEAGIRPICVSREKSFVGFFGREKFQCFKEAMSFEQMWSEINKGFGDGEPARIYIVSWNDHFFVLKVEEDACYIVDSLGERLFEGCNEAYILKFDSSSSMYGSVEGREMEICRGKECCREFIKRFLAAIPLGELAEGQKKGTVDYSSLHQRLQIDFSYIYGVSVSAASSNCSLFSTDDNE